MEEAALGSSKRCILRHHYYQEWRCSTVEEGQGIGCRQDGAQRSEDRCAVEAARRRRSAEEDSVCERCLPVAGRMIEGSHAW